MPDERPIPDRILEVAVFVPVGIALSIVEDLPGLAEKGRRRVTKEVDVARMIGKLAVKQAERFAAKVGVTAPGRPSAPPPPPTGASRHRVAPDGAPTVAGSGEGEHEHRRGHAAEPAPVRRPSPKAPAASRPRQPAARGSRDAEGAAESPGGAESAPDVATLPIPGYDTLAASQVVQRLSSLRPDELDAVKRYELANRQRRTILHRIAQLTASPGDGLS